MQPLPFALLALVGSIISPSSSAPAKSSKSEFYSSMSSSNSSFSSDTSRCSKKNVTTASGYHVSMDRDFKDGKCLSTTTITGNSIHKVLEYPCANHSQSVIDLNNKVLVEDSGNEFFSDTEGVLVRVTKNECTEEIFTKQGKGWTSSETPLSKQECDKIKGQIKELKKEHARYDEFMKLHLEQMDMQLAQLQSTLDDFPFPLEF